MTIEIRQLRYAVATADTQSFSRAAAQLRVKQSTLSKRIAVLEGQLGIKLFDRSTRGATPSESGKAFLEVARRIVTDVDNLKSTATAVQYGEVGRIVVSFSTSLSGGNLKTMIGDYLGRYPEIQFDGVEVGGERMVSGLQTKVIDVAIHADDLLEEGISKRPLWSERLMVALPVNHPLASAESILWTDLRREVFVVSNMAGGPVIAELIANRMSAQGYKSYVISQETAQENVLGIVGFEKFITIVTESALGIERPGLVLREIKEPHGHAKLDFAAYWRADNDNPALKRFFKMVDERYPAAGAP